MPRILTKLHQEFCASPREERGTRVEWNSVDWAKYAPLYRKKRRKEEKKKEKRILSILLFHVRSINSFVPSPPFQNIGNSASWSLDFHSPSHRPLRRVRDRSQRMTRVDSSNVEGPGRNCRLNGWESAERNAEGFDRTAKELGTVVGNCGIERCSTVGVDLLGCLTVDGLVLL